MQNLYKPTTPIYWARLHRPAGKPPLAEIVPVAYLRPATRLDYHRVKVPGRKFPAEAHKSELHRQPENAHNALALKIQTAIGEHDIATAQLYEQLMRYTAIPLIDWTHASPAVVHQILLPTQDLVMETEPAIVNGTADLKDAILAHASRKSAQRRLIMQAHLAALDNAASLKQISALEERQANPELMLEIPPLLPCPEENVMPPTSPDSRSPSKTTRARPVSTTTHEDETREPPHRKAKPTRFLKNPPTSE